MEVAEVTTGGKLHTLDSLKKAVQLGKDTFTGGILSEESIRATCETLRDFKKIMDTYGVVVCFRQACKRHRSALPPRGCRGFAGAAAPTQ
jgi:exopolyphosphatase/pppGpp-phosphohydrolase